MKRKKISGVFLALSVSGILLNGCEQKLQFDFKAQTPVPVVNSVLRAGDDTVRVRVTWTRNVYEQEDFPVEADASVKLYKNDHLVGECSYLKDGWYAIAHPVEATGTYRVEARINGQPLVWGETRVPALLLHASIECDSLRDRIINRWTDRAEEKNYYWLSATYSTDRLMDTSHMVLQSYIETNSTLPDAFNRSFDFEEEIPAEYDYYVRIEDSGLSGKDIELSYKGRRYYSSYWEPDSGCYKSTRFILSLDESYDRYLKASILNEDYMLDMDSEPLFYSPLWTYSNIHGGTGLVASYSKYEDVFIEVFQKREE
ncbi:DUF4249 domain-containing protein [Butyricimonas hominis]|uniref:DUF4249 domain-containing protein n=1 Tax=Butyricimonas hominis TaxID=2763032 RepID=UPI0026DD8DE3|nr:DUF4249 domain-containing protein [uncultured Butyricimonas sp.]